MRKYYMSYVDFTEIANITTDTEQLNRATERMKELGILTEKGNPSTVQLTSLANSIVPSFLSKLERRLRRREGVYQTTLNNICRLYEQKEYHGLYLYLAILYGFLEWRVPERLSLLPGDADTLKSYFAIFIAMVQEALISAESKKFETDVMQEESI